MFEQYLRSVFRIGVLLGVFSILGEISAFLWFWGKLWDNDNTIGRENQDG